MKKTVGCLVLAAIMPFRAQAGEFEKMKSGALSQHLELAPIHQALQKDIKEKRIGEKINPAILPFVDVFSQSRACDILNARFFRALTVEEAIEALRPCMASIAKRYQVDIKMSEHIFTNGPWLLGGPVGISINVSPRLNRGNPVVRCLKETLARRGNTLLGHRAEVAVLLGPIVPRPILRRTSSLQEAVNKCVIPEILYDYGFKPAEVFARVYGGCLKRAPELRIIGMIAPKDAADTLYIYSNANEETIAGMNGAVRVYGAQGAGHEGTVTIHILADSAVIIAPRTNTR